MALADLVWEAVRFDRAMLSGRTKPLLLECAQLVGDTERRGRFVVKALGLPEVADFTLCHEFLGCRLARLFGLSAPESVLINLSPTFVQAIRADLEREGLHPKAGLAVGVHYVRNLQGFPAAATLGAREIVDAARIYAFDLAVQNFDRTRRSPNCGRGPGGLVPYDFESAFSFRFALVTPEPWTAPRMSVARQHLFHSQLRAAAVDWAGVFGPMREVTQRDAAVECGTIPNLWLAVAADVQNHLASLIGHWTEFESEVVASLA